MGKTVESCCVSAKGLSANIELETKWDRDWQLEKSFCYKYSGDALDKWYDSTESYWADKNSDSDHVNSFVYAMFVIRDFVLSVRLGERKTCLSK